MVLPTNCFIDSLSLSGVTDYNGGRRGTERRHRRRSLAAWLLSLSLYSTIKCRHLSVGAYIYTFIINFLYIGFAHKYTHTHTYIHIHTQAVSCKAAGRAPLVAHCPFRLVALLESMILESSTLESVYFLQSTG